MAPGVCACSAKNLVRRRGFLFTGGFQELDWLGFSLLRMGGREVYSTFSNNRPVLLPARFLFASVAVYLNHEEKSKAVRQSCSSGTGKARKVITERGERDPAKRPQSIGHSESRSRRMRLRQRLLSLSHEEDSSRGKPLAKDWFGHEPLCERFSRR